jgi:hypothetical protein
LLLSRSVAGPSAAGGTCPGSAAAAARHVPPPCSHQGAQGGQPVAAAACRVQVGLHHLLGGTPWLPGPPAAISSWRQQEQGPVSWCAPIALPAPPRFCMHQGESSRCAAHQLMRSSRVPHNNRLTP